MLFPRIFPAAGDSFPNFPVWLPKINKILKDDATRQQYDYAIEHLEEIVGVWKCTSRSFSALQPYNFWSTDSRLSNFFAGSVCVFSVIFTGQLIAWSMLGSQKNNVFIMLGSSVARFLIGKLIRDPVVWGEVPLELWGEIGKCLVSQLDIVRFRSVCKLWRSSLHSPTRFPLWLPPPPNVDPELSSTTYALTEVNMYRYTEWLPVYFAFEEVEQGGKFQVPITSFKEAMDVWSNLPVMESPRHPFNRLTFVGKAHHLRLALPCFDSHNVRVEGKWKFVINKMTKKTVLISSNEVGGNLAYAEASEISVVAHLSCGEMNGRLALLRLGGSSENWDWDTNFCNKVFEEVGTYKGQLCMLDHCGRVFVMDYDSLQMTQIASPSSVDREMKTRHLFEYRGDLYLVDNAVQDSEDIVSCKLSLQLHKWIKVDSRDHLSALVPYLL